MAKTLIGIIPKYKGEFTTENYKSVTFQRMNYAKIGEDYYQSLVDDNLGVELTDTNKWMKLTYKEENDKNISEAVKRTNDAVDAFNKTLLEHAAITISINHSDDRASLNGKNIYIKKVSDDSILTIIPIKEGTDSYSYDLQPDTSYYVTTDELEGYTVPNSGKLSAISNNVREIALKFESEWFYPTLTREDGEATEDTNMVLVYNIKGTRTSMAYHAGMVIKVPMGIRYQLVPESKAGQIAGVFPSLVAASDTYSYSASYKTALSQIGIQLSDGSIILADKWDDTKNNKSDVIGIIVCTSGVKCVIAVLDSYPRLPWGNWGDFPNGCDVQTDPQFIKGQLGESNTAAIIAAHPADNTFAAGFCYNTVLKNGRRCYLPASDELREFYANKDAINACSQKILGIDIITFQWIWSSNLLSKDKAWCFRTICDYDYRFTPHCVLPVSAL